MRTPPATAYPHKLVERRPHEQEREREGSRQRTVIMDGTRICIVLLAILAAVASTRAVDPPLGTQGGVGPGFPVFPKPGKCTFANGRWICPGPPDIESCRCCSLDKRARPPGCADICRVVACARPIPPPNPTPEDCGCCEGVRRNIPGCRSVCDTFGSCPGAPIPIPVPVPVPSPVNCGCCTKHQKGTAECLKLCGIRCTIVPKPPKCECCKPQKFVKGANKVSVTVSAPGCDCTTVLCPAVEVETTFSG